MYVQNVENAQIVKRLRIGEASSSSFVAPQEVPK